MRPQVEDFVQETSTELEGRRVSDEPLFGELATGFLAYAVILPVGVVIDEALLLVEQRVEQDQASQPAGIAGCEERADATPEAGTDEGNGPDAREEVQVVDGGFDVVDNASEGQILLTALACSVRPQVEAQGGDARVRQASGEAGEETAFFSGDPPAVDENRSAFRDRGKQAGAAQAKPIKAGKLGLADVHVQ